MCLCLPTRSQARHLRRMVHRARKLMISHWCCLDSGGRRAGAEVRVTPNPMTDRVIVIRLIS